MRLGLTGLALVVAAWVCGSCGAALAVEGAPSARDIQQALSARGFDVGAVDGKWGKRSERALQAFQSANGLAPSGTLDAATSTRLFPERFGLRAQMALRPEERTEALLTSDSAELVTIYRIARTGAGRCPVRRFDAARIEQMLRSRFATRFDELSAVVEAAGSRETTGLPFLDQTLPMKSCDGWTAVARGLGLVVDQPDAGSTASGSVAGAAPPAASPASAAPPATVPSPPLAEPTPQSSASQPWRLSWREVGGAALVFFGFLWWGRRRGRRPPAIDTAPPPMPASGHGFIGVAPPASPGAEEAAQAGALSLAARLAEHNRTVAEAIGARTAGGAPQEQAASGLREAVFPIGDGARAPATSPVNAPAGDAVWIAAGVRTTIAGLIVPGGMLWVGGRLRRRNDPSRNENCLIDPKLPVSSAAGFAAQALPYWPSYSDIPPSSRRAFVDWLSGPRADPGTNIGFVFLYFYGLERRLMLDAPAPDRDAVRAEVERLLAIYGENHSFRRYATELLAAEAIRSAGLAEDLVLDHDVEGFDVPLPIRIALGVRVRDGRAIEPDLLLAFVRTHPETRLRTPARRAATELQDLFAIEAEKVFPKGVRVGNASRIKKLKASYSAASGSFEVDLLPEGHGLPDITGLSEPLGAGRRILDDCTTRLDAYSRELGRLDGLRPTLAAVAKLPAEIRLDRARLLPGNPLGILSDLAETGDPIPAQAFCARLGFAGGDAIDKGRLREWSAIAGSLGFGLTCDPAFALRAARADSPVVVFPLRTVADGVAAPGDGFRSAQVSVALAMMVALADGAAEAVERQALLDLIARAEGVTNDERRRLVAEVHVQTVDPHGISDLRTRLKALPKDLTDRLADEIVTIAGADGVVAPREVAFLEKLFRQIGLDDKSLYGRLHGGVAAVDATRTEALPPSAAAASAPAAAPRAGAGALDLGRLAAIRRETASLSSVLSEIFAEDDEIAPAAPLPVPAGDMPDDDGGLDGLDRRYRSLVEEIVERAEWSRSDFERLVRGVGLMSGAAIETLNDWAIDRLGDCLLEGEDPIVANLHLLPRELARADA